MNWAKAKINDRKWKGVITRPSPGLLACTDIAVASRPPETACYRTRTAPTFPALLAELRMLIEQAHVQKHAAAFPLANNIATAVDVLGGQLRLVTQLAEHTTGGRSGIHKARAQTTVQITARWMARDVACQFPPSGCDLPPCRSPRLMYCYRRRDRAQHKPATRILAAYDDRSSSETGLHRYF